MTDNEFEEMKAWVVEQQTRNEDVDEAPCWFNSEEASAWRSGRCKAFEDFMKKFFPQ